MRHLFPLLAFALVGCAPLFTLGEDTKDAAAIAKVEQLQAYAKTHMTRTDGEQLKSLDVLAQYAEDSEKALIDPWGQPFQFSYVHEPETQQERLVIWTIAPESRQIVASPRHLTHLIEPPN